MLNNTCNMWLSRPMRLEAPILKKKVRGGQHLFGGGRIQNMIFFYFAVGIGWLKTQKSSKTEEEKIKKD